jgi:ubiquinone/menaquinone biosynthesis C-methylase UbiE
MSAEIRDSYDAMADLYASLNLDALDHDTNARDWLAAFAELAAPRRRVVADLGCGPGHIVHHLSELDLNVIGYDLSEGQIAQARTAFPDCEFHVGDLAALDVTDSSIGGIVSRYSIIHIVPSLLSKVFAEWMRVLVPEAPVLVSFFGSLSAEAHGAPFDHKVATAYELSPGTIAQQLRDAGFVDIEIGTRPTPDGERPFDQATILATKPCI